MSIGTDPTAGDPPPDEPRLPEPVACRYCGLPASLKRLRDGYCSASCREAAEGGPPEPGKP